MPLKIILWRSPSPASPVIGTCILRYRQALARQRCLRRLQRDGLNQPRIGWNGVAFFDEDDVSGYDLDGRDGLSRAISNDAGVRGGHLAQRRHGFFGSGLLNVTHHRVEQHDREDRHRLVGQSRFALIRATALLK